MDDFLKYIVSEWAVIRQTPVVFVAAILVVIGLVYFAIDWRYSSVISSLKERISLRDDQIGQLKDKVGTASPDEIKARIDRLESEVKALSPRRLSDAQRSQLTTGLRRLPGTIQILQDMAAPDARGFAGDLIVAFQNAGWQVQTPAILGPGNPPPHGIGLIVSDPASLTPHQSLIAEALRAIGVQFDLQRGSLASPSGVPGRPPTSLDAEILITQQVL